MKILLKVFLFHLGGGFFVTVPRLMILVGNVQTVDEALEMAVRTHPALDAQTLKSSVAEGVHGDGVGHKLVVRRCDSTCSIHIEVADSFVLTEGLEEVFIHILVNVRVLEQERLDGTRDLDELVDGLGHIPGLNFGVCGVNKLDLG